MNKRKLIIIGSIIVIVGVGGYFGYQWYKKRKEKKESENKGSSTTPTSVDSSSTSITPSATSQYSFPSSWTTKEGDAFRQWVRANYPDYAKQIDLDASGSLNAYVDKAYQKYGTIYQNSLKVQSASKDIRFAVGESVKTNKPVVVTPYRIVNNNFAKTGESNKTLTTGTSLVIARKPFMVDGKVTYRVNPSGFLGTDKDIFYTIYQEHLQIA
jgi:hypothetical protein